MPKVVILVPCQLFLFHPQTILHTMSDYSHPSSLPITSWAEDDRPREKMLTKGRQALSDAELLAILLGSGTKNESAVAVAQKILSASANNLHQLAQLTIQELMQFKGVGIAKAITIAAALELGRRRQAASILEKPLIQSSQDAFKLLYPYVADLNHEEFWVLFLNKRNKVLAHEKISAGGTDSTIVDLKILFLKALQWKAQSLIICHNHPSGNLNPSPQDIDLTKKIKEACKILGFNLLDHIIIANDTYYSFTDVGSI